MRMRDRDRRCGMGGIGEREVGKGYGMGGVRLEDRAEHYLHPFLTLPFLKTTFPCNTR